MRNKNKLIITISLFCAVLLMSIGFAALNTELTINGMGTVKSSTWDIQFVNLGNALEVGEANEITPPTLTATNIKDFSVSLRKIDDSISYTFDVINNSEEYDAKITSITIPTPTCTGNGTNANIDAANVCKYLTYTLSYSNGTEVKIGDILSKEQSRSLVLKLSYGNSNVTASELAKSDVTVSNLGIKIIYSQS